MASSSGNKPTTEERLNSLEEDLQRLKHMLHHQLDFLQNLDIDAGRRLEMLEADITTTKFGLTEELGKLRKELRDPKQEFENRVSNLEEKMKQLNKEWKRRGTSPSRMIQSNLINSSEAWNADLKPFSEEGVLYRSLRSK
jgi:predicted  nucleic acid-binding Zn-ribbon protein